MTDANEKKIADILGTDTASQEVAEKAVAEAKKDLNEEMRLRKIKLIKIGSIMMFVAIMMIFMTLGWFVSNKNVSTNNNGVKSTDMPYELSVPDRTGAITAYDSYLQNVYGYDTTLLSTGSGSASIKWVMTDETRKKSTDGLRPGSYGSLTFYVVPSRTGTMTIHFDLSLQGFYADFDDEPTIIKTGTLKSLSEKYTELSQSEQPGDVVRATKFAEAQNLIKGHILFYENKKVLTETELDEETDGAEYYSKLIDTQTGFDRTFTFSQAGEAGKKEVTIYWIWPNTFSQILYDNGNKALYDDAMFSSSQATYMSEITGTTVSPRDELKSFISSNSTYYFKSNSISNDNIASLLTLDDPDSIIVLSNGYNNADQVIGETTKLVLLELTSIPK